MTLFQFILILLVLGAIFSYPRYPYSRTWGYYPFGTLAAVAFILLLAILAGVL